MTAPGSIGLLVYDGACGFCANALRRLRGVLPLWPEVVAWQAIDLAAHGLTPEQVVRAAWWIEPGRVPAGGAAAFAALLARQPAKRWRALGWLLSTPPASWVAALVYAVVARTRHRLPAGAATCRASPPPEEGSSGPGGA